MQQVITQVILLATFTDELMEVMERKHVNRSF